MAGWHPKLKFRYNGITQEFNARASAYNPDRNGMHLGTARLNMKYTTTSENASSETVTVTNKTAFGLTTDPNASSYCNLIVRVGGQIARLGHQQSISYYQSDSGTVTRGNSSVASSDTALEYYNQNTVNGTSSGVKPIVGINEDANGRSETLEVAEYDYLSATWYSMTMKETFLRIGGDRKTTWNLNEIAPGTNKTRLIKAVYTSTYNRQGSSYSYKHQTYNEIYSRYTYATKNKGSNSTYHSASGVDVAPRSVTVQITNQFNTSKSAVNSDTTVPSFVTDSVNSHTYETYTYSNDTQTRACTSAYSTSQSGTVKTRAAYTTTSAYIGYVLTYSTFQIANAIATNYSYSKRWSYTSSSAAKRTIVSETIHNFNI